MFCKRSLPLLALLLALAGLPVSAAQSGEAQSISGEAERAWARVRSLEAGTELVVEPKTGDSYRANFVAASQDKLTLAVKGGTVEAERALISRLYMVSRKSRSGSALAGAGSGRAAGLSRGLFVFAVGGRAAHPKLAPVRLGLAGLLAGAVTGAFTGGKRKGQLLYESK